MRLRSIAIILVLLMLVGGAMAQGSYYPQQIGTGKTIKSYGGTNYAMVPALQIIAAAESSDDDQLFAATTGHCNQTTNILKTTFLAQPDVPRNLIATFNASTSGSIKITGTDISGAAITENLTISSASSAASTKAFKTVTLINADLTAGETNKTLKMGTGNLLALNEKLGTYDQVCDTYVNGVIESTAAAVTKNSTVLSLNTVDTASAPGGYVTLVYYMLKG
jgi:hypothetical protein